MRSSDWSSDVCSSDLIGVSFIFVPIQILAFAGIASQDMGSASAIINLMRNIGGGMGISIVTTYLARSTQIEHSHLVDRVSMLDPVYQSRSEEHTSELQSLMRISYAVFCLKKTKTHHQK